MSDAAGMLKDLSEPWGPGELVREAVERSARLAKLSFTRTSDIWYGKARKIEDTEIEKIQQALRIKNEKAARNELHELKFRLARLEARLIAGDSDFYRPDADFIGDQLRGPGRMDRAVDRKR